MKRSLPRRFATWLGIPCLVLLLACRAFADDNVIGESGGGSQKAATPSPKSPDNASQEELKSGIAALQKRLKSPPPTQSPSPRIESAKEEPKAPVADWAGTWVGELTCIDSPQGDEGRTAVFVARICTDHSRATVQAGKNPPTHCDVVISGTKAVLTGVVRGTSFRFMKETTVMMRSGKNLASVTLHTINDRGITSAVAGEMERQ
ncbi:MAG: hypothetical protein WC003_17325 [Terrimicrobiaceae bacterium]